MTESVTAVAAVLDEAVSLEKQLDAARQRTAKAIRALRETRGHSLRTIAKSARLSPAALSELERGRTWNSKTAAKVLRALGRAGDRRGADAAAGGASAPSAQAA